MKGKDYAYSQLADYDLRFMVISASEANQGVAGALPPARYYCYKLKFKIRQMFQINLDDKLFFKMRIL